MLVDLKLEIETVAVLVAGVYIDSNGIPDDFIPNEVWLGVTEELLNFLPSWNYDKKTLEEWVSESLIITSLDNVDEKNCEFYVKFDFCYSTFIAYSLSDEYIVNQEVE